MQSLGFAARWLMIRCDDQLREPNVIDLSIALREPRAQIGRLHRIRSVFRLQRLAGVGFTKIASMRLENFAEIIPSVLP